MISVSGLPAKQLLTLHARVAEELRSRGITRSSNSPTGDLAEYLFCKAFGWLQAGNSNPNIDAIAPDGMRYQIKGRRITRHNKSRQLSGIRDFQGQHFDFLAGAVFMESYEVFRAAIIPYAIVEARARFVPHTNSHKFILHEDVWNLEGVRDVTAELRSLDF
jgi:hypothetical protein